MQKMEPIGHFYERKLKKEQRQRGEVCLHDAEADPLNRLLVMEES